MRAAAPRTGLPDTLWKLLSENRPEIPSAEVEAHFLALAQAIERNLGARGR